MARLSLWKDGKHSNDYKFIDRRISEMFTIGGTGVLLNKYLGAQPQGIYFVTSSAQASPGTTLNFSSTTGILKGMFVYGTGIPAGTTVSSINATTITLSTPTTVGLQLGTKIGFSADASQPAYTNQSEKNIQDLLWTENRDRKYDRDIYKMRGIYQRADQDFDLTQFGLFLQTGTIFMVFHLRDMVDLIGRKLMSGDVLELEHLKDYDALDTDLPAALKRYYVVGDASFASEGFSPTWWPHLWRVKLNPMVDSQEYRDILNNIAAGPGTTTPVGTILSTYEKYKELNTNILAQAEFDVPLSGYDTTNIFHLGTVNGNDPQPGPLTIDNANVTIDTTGITSDAGVSSPEAVVSGYLTGIARGPNAINVTGAGIAFPVRANEGDYYLRLDYLPNRVFRFDGSQWRAINDAVRTNITPGAANNLTQRDSFIDNNTTYQDSSSVTHNERQNLSDVLTPRADN